MRAEIGALTLGFVLFVDSACFTALRLLISDLFWMLMIFS